MPKKDVDRELLTLVKFPEATFEALGRVYSKYKVEINTQVKTNVKHIFEFGNQ